MKTIIKIVLGLFILLVLLLVGSLFFLGSIVKIGVEKAGPRVTKTDVKLQSAKLSIFSGSGELKGFVIGNPEGFKSPSALKVDSVAIHVQPRSVLSDKVIIQSISLLSPDITFEGDLSGNNLGKLLDNIKGSSEKDKQTTTKTEKSSQKKFEVDDFLITGAKVHLSTTLLGGGATTRPIPEIHLKNLGQGPDGITAAELGEQVFAALFQNTIKAVTEQAGNIGKDAANQILKGTTTNVVPNVTKGINDLFKKK
jgi:uncharacterized protein involved in outer membrane biogenesis